MEKVISMILAGGQGSRLSILSDHRAKPAVPFGGIYRIIDFTMTNVMESHIPVVGILTQYKPSSLMDHISTGAAWGFTGRKHHAKILPPYIGEADSDWYAGTADAVYQNLNFIERFAPDLVFVLSGDHIYKMSYNELLEFHLQKKADLTIAVQEVPYEERDRFGIAVIDSDQRMINFVEKSKEATSNLASLGIYLFNRTLLENILQEDAVDEASSHDFGKDVIPKIMKKARVFCFIFKDYWRDVGTLDAYFTTHQELLNPLSGLDIFHWNVHTNINLEHLNTLMPLHITSRARVHHSLISPGCIIEGDVIDSILSPGVHVRPGARVEKSVIMHNAELGENSHVSHTILDKNTIIGKNSQVGAGEARKNRESPHLLSSGLTVFGKNVLLPDNMIVGKNCLIYPNLKEKDFHETRIPSGETIKPKFKGKYDFMQYQKELQKS